MTHDPERPSRTSWLLRFFDPDGRFSEPLPAPPLEVCTTEPDNSDDEPPASDSCDFPGWDAMIMALMA